MKTTIKVLILCFITCSIQSTFAQIDATRLLKRKIERKLNDVLEREADKAIDSAIAKKERERKSNGTQTTDVQVDNGEAQEADKTISGLDSKLGKLIGFDAKPKSNYAFSASILEKMTLIDKKKTETSYLKILFNPSHQSIAVIGLDANKAEKAEQGNMLVDMEQKAFFIFNTDKKGGKNYIGMRLKEPVQDNNTATSDVKPKVITPTGKHKTIMGYDCEGYLMEGDKGDSFVYWVTSRTVAGMDSYVGAMRRYAANQPQTAMSSNETLFRLVKEGKSVLGHDYTAKNGDQMLMELEKINMSDANSFNTEGYKSSFGK